MQRLADEFSVVNQPVLQTGGPPDFRAGHTASLSMTFSGATVSGDPVSVTTGGYLYAVGDAGSVLFSGLLQMLAWFLVAFALLPVLLRLAEITLSEPECASAQTHLPPHPASSHWNYRKN